MVNLDPLLGLELSDDGLAVMVIWTFSYADALSSIGPDPVRALEAADASAAVLASQFEIPVGAFRQFVQVAAGRHEVGDANDPRLESRLIAFEASYRFAVQAKEEGSVMHGELVPSDGDEP